MAKYLLIRFRITNPNLRNMKLLLKLLTGKPKKQNAHLEPSIVIQDLFIEIIYYAIQSI